MDCSTDRSLCDAHHRDRVVTNGVRSSLVVLCKLDQAAEHPDRYRVSPDERARIERLRREQGISHPAG